MIGIIHIVPSSNTHIECQISTIEHWTMPNIDKIDTQKNEQHPQKNIDKI